jgi:hypothetical protein
MVVSLSHKCFAQNTKIIRHNTSLSGMWEDIDSNSAAK